MYQAGFIGAGNMGSALALAAAKKAGGANIVIIDHNIAKTKQLIDQTSCHEAGDSKELAANSRFIFIAVKPYAVRKVIKDILPVLKEDKASGKEHIIVTIAAGVSIQAVREVSENTCPVIRLMPNTPAAVGKGTTLITWGEDVTKEIAEEFLSLMSESGSFERIDESRFDITSSISGCTPAYAYMFIEALADGAVQMGVPREQAIRLAAQTLLGSAAMVLESGKHPDQLKDEVCSPGGSTIAGVAALEENRFRYAAAQAIVRSTEKNLLLGK